MIRPDRIRQDEIGRTSGPADRPSGWLANCQMDGWTSRRTGERLDGLAEGWTDRWTVGQTSWWSNSPAEGRMDRQIVEQTSRYISGQTGQWTDWQMVGWTAEGQVDNWKDQQGGGGILKQSCSHYVFGNKNPSKSYRKSA